MRESVSQIWGWDEADQAARFRTTSDLTLIEVITVDGRDAGVLQVKRRAGEVYLENIEIAPDFQGAGLGSAVIGDLMREAHGRGVPLTLQVNRANRARRLYERLGFVETGQTETHHLMRADPPAPSAAQGD
jgi:ribosomal protein S18 acetylase RimI-like enzyme